MTRQEALECALRFIAPELDTIGPTRLGVLVVESTIADMGPSAPHIFHIVDNLPELGISTPPAGWAAVVVILDDVACSTQAQCVHQSDIEVHA